MGATPDAAAIFDDARSTIAKLHATGDPFTVRTGVKVWSTKMLHEIVLGIHLDDADCKEFVFGQEKLIIVCVFMLNTATDLVGPQMGLDALVKFRAKWLKRYKTALSMKDFASGLNTNRMHTLASAFLDAMLFAGGTSVSSAISCALAVVYAVNSPLARDAVPNDKDEHFAKSVTWEIIRYFPPAVAVAFPWVEPGGSTNRDSAQRTCLALCAAMKDPRVWRGC